jgi:hypothetical protein
MNLLERRVIVVISAATGLQNDPDYVVASGERPASKVGVPHAGRISVKRALGCAPVSTRSWSYCLDRGWVDDCTRGLERIWHPSISSAWPEIGGPSSCGETRWASPVEVRSAGGLVYMRWLSGPPRCVGGRRVD